MDDFFTKEITPFAKITNEIEPSLDNDTLNENPSIKGEERWKFTDKGRVGKLKIFSGPSH